jgi:hypothetical protein
VLRALCLVLLAGLGCRAGNDDKSGTPLPAPADGPFEAPPPRTVIDDYPPGLSAPPFDADTTETASPADTAPPDRPADQAADDAGVSPCSLLAQDCANPLAGCYPGSRGDGICKPAGDLPEGTGCLGFQANEECRKGLLCVDAFGLGQGRTCQRICDPRSAMTCKTGVCQAFPGSSVGSCPP